MKEKAIKGENGKDFGNKKFLKFFLDILLI